MRTDRKKLVVIAGPTAVGKTAVALELAGRLNTEIISADSRQLFRELTIGTAKPSDEELRAARHHFINSHSITEDYDAAQFGRDALPVIQGIFQHHHYAILCGGSGLYIKAVCEGFDDIPQIPGEVRDELTTQFNNHGIEWLQEQMSALDPDHLKTIDRQNPHRLIRALEVKIATGMSISSFRKNEKPRHDFDIVKVGLELPREELYSRIDNRMDQMIAAGLFDEAKGLYRYKHHNALQTVGYQEIFDFMDGAYDHDEAVRLLKRNSRRYAKRQLTWFRRDAEMRWFSPLEKEKILEYILEGRYET